MPTAFRAARGAFALVAAFAVSGCATKGDLRTVRAEIQALSARQDSILRELRFQSSTTQDSIRRTYDQLFQIRGDVMTTLNRISEDLSRLAELTGQNQLAIASVNDQIDALRRTGVGSSGGFPGPGGPAVSGDDATALYQTGLDLKGSGSFVAARAAFNDFIANHPNDPRVGDARYHLGDMLAQDGRPTEAIDAFGSIRQLHPTHARVPDALYRIGMLHLELDERDEARRHFEMVINTYPDSQAAPLARQRLADMGGSGF